MESEQERSAFDDDDFNPKDQKKKNNISNLGAGPYHVISKYLEPQEMIALLTNKAIQKITKDIFNLLYNIATAAAKEKFEYGPIKVGNFELKIDSNGKTTFIANEGQNIDEVKEFIKVVTKKFALRKKKESDLINAEKDSEKEEKDSKVDIAFDLSKIHMSRGDAESLLELNEKLLQKISSINISDPIDCSFYSGYDEEFSKSLLNKLSNLETLIAPKACINAKFLTNKIKNLDCKDISNEKLLAKKHHLETLKVYSVSAKNIPYRLKILECKCVRNQEFLGEKLRKDNNLEPLKLETLKVDSIDVKNIPDSVKNLDLDLISNKKSLAEKHHLQTLKVNDSMYAEHIGYSVKNLECHYVVDEESESFKNCNVENLTCTERDIKKENWPKGLISYNGKKIVTEEEKKEEVKESGPSRSREENKSRIEELKNEDSKSHLRSSGMFMSSNSQT